jgi:hypothetical protein
VRGLLKGTTGQSIGDNSASDKASRKMSTRTPLRTNIREFELCLPIDYSDDENVRVWGSENARTHVPKNTGVEPHGNTQARQTVAYFRLSSALELKMLTAACQASSRTAPVDSRFLMRAIAGFHDLDLKAAGFADPNLVQFHLSATRHLFSLLNGLSVQGEQARILPRMSHHVKKAPQACSQPILS